MTWPCATGSPAPGGADWCAYAVARTVVVIDDGQSSVPALPPRVDDRAAGQGMYRRARRCPDVDSRVNPPHRRPNGTRDRTPRSGQISPLEDGVASVGVLDCAPRIVVAERGALRSRRPSASCRYSPCSRGRWKAAGSYPAGRSERVPCDDEQPVAAHRALLGRPHSDRLRLDRDAVPDLLRPLARAVHLVAGGLHLARDPVVLCGDLAEVVELVEQVGEGRRREDDGERVRVVRLVDRDQAVVQPRLRLDVLAAQEDQPSRLENKKRRVKESSFRWCQSKVLSSTPSRLEAQSTWPLSVRICDVTREIWEERTPSASWAFAIFAFRAAIRASTCAFRGSCPSAGAASASAQRRTSTRRLRMSNVRQEPARPSRYLGARTGAPEPSARGSRARSAAAARRRSGPTSSR